MTCDQRATLNGVVIDGKDPDADYILMQEGISGLGLADPASFGDLPRGDDHGGISGPDYTLPRTLRIPVEIAREDDPQAAMEALRVLKAAWKPAATDQQLQVYVPGIGPDDHTMRFYGRPRGNLEVNLRQLYLGVVYCFCTFVALDPVGYGALETTGPSSGTFTVTNGGDATSRRATITIAGNGGTPVIVNNTDGGADVRFGQALGGGSTLTIDLADQTVVDGSGNDAFEDNVLSASLWPRLVSGANSLTLTGAASATVQHRDGWW